jgi:hypothetical protein
MAAYIPPEFDSKNFNDYPSQTVVRDYNSAANAERAKQIAYTTTLERQQELSKRFSGQPQATRRATMYPEVVKDANTTYSRQQQAIRGAAGNEYLNRMYGESGTGVGPGFPASGRGGRLHRKKTATKRRYKKKGGSKKNHKKRTRTQRRR